MIPRLADGLRETSGRRGQTDQMTMAAPCLIGLSRSPFPRRVPAAGPRRADAVCYPILQERGHGILPLVVPASVVAAPAELHVPRVDVRHPCASAEGVVGGSPPVPARVVRPGALQPRRHTAAASSEHSPRISCLFLYFLSAIIPGCVSGPLRSDPVRFSHFHLGIRIALGFNWSQRRRRCCGLGAGTRDKVGRF